MSGAERSVMSRPDTLIEVVRRVEAGERFDYALSEFLDDFYLLPERRQAMIDPEPPPLADTRQHAVLGGVGEHLARRWGLSIPKWTNDPSRFLHEPYFTTQIEDLKAMLLVQSPLAFRRRMIFTEAEPLRRARMPRSSASP
jgi:hypothetical protein